MTRSQAQRFRELVEQGESLRAAIAVNEWALEHHIKLWTEQASEEDPKALNALSMMIGAHTDVIRKLVETQHKIEHDQRLSWTPRQVQNFIMQVAGIIDMFVSDMKVKRKIAANLESLIKNRKYIEWPQEDSAEAIIARVYGEVLPRLPAEERIDD